MAAPSKTVSPCVSSTVEPLFFSSSVVHVCLGVRGREVWVVTDGEGLRHLTPVPLCEPFMNTHIKLGVRQRSDCQLGFSSGGKYVRNEQNLTRI